MRNYKIILMKLKLIKMIIVLVLLMSGESKMNNLIKKSSFLKLSNRKLSLSEIREFTVSFIGGIISSILSNDYVDVLVKFITESLKTEAQEEVDKSKPKCDYQTISKELLSIGEEIASEVKGPKINLDLPHLDEKYDCFVSNIKCDRESDEEIRKICVELLNEEWNKINNSIGYLNKQIKNTIGYANQGKLALQTIKLAQDRALIQEKKQKLTSFKFIESIKKTIKVFGYFNTITGPYFLYKSFKEYKDKIGPIFSILKSKMTKVVSASKNLLECVLKNKYKKYELKFEKIKTAFLDEKQSGFFEIIKNFGKNIAEHLSNLFGGKVGRMLKSIITIYEGIKQFIKAKEKRSFALLGLSLGKIVGVIFSLCIMKVRKKKKLR